MEWNKLSYACTFLGLIVISYYGRRHEGAMISPYPRYEQKRIAARGGLFEENKSKLCENGVPLEKTPSAAAEKRTVSRLFQEERLAQSHFV